MVDVGEVTAAKKTVKKTAKKGAKKATKKVAKKVTKAKTAKGANGAKKLPKSTIGVEEVVNMMKRKGGVTVKQMNEAGYWQPAKSAVKAAERRELNPTQEKVKGSPTVYRCDK